MVKIFIDADACPVKREVERVAKRHNLETFWVCNGGLRPPLNPLIKLIVVNKTDDAADDWIIGNIVWADICVTSDIPLANQCLKKGAFAIRPNGETFTENNIGMALATRGILEAIRDTGEQIGGPPAFRRTDRSKFLDRLEIVVQKALYNSNKDHE